MGDLTHEAYRRGSRVALFKFGLEQMTAPKGTKPPLGTPTPQAAPPTPPTGPQFVQQGSSSLLMDNALTSPDKFVQPMMKAGEFNFGLHGKPVHPDPIMPDNGRGVLGTNFSEPFKRTGSSREVNKAFNDLEIQRNLDFLNEAGQGLIGSAPNGDA